MAGKAGHWVGTVVADNSVLVTDRTNKASNHTNIEDRVRGLKAKELGDHELILISPRPRSGRLNRETAANAQVAAATGKLTRTCVAWPN